MTQPPLRVLIGSLAVGALPNARDPELPAGTIVLDLGADHPSRAGLVELRVWTADERIRRCEVVIGALHRGAEKLYEMRDYRQIIMLADRHDWQAPFAGELGVAMLCEQQLGLEVPARAVWLRTLLAEVTRIGAHLSFLGYLDRAHPEATRNRSASRTLRERIAVLLQRLTGNRVHPMINRIGGLSVDASDHWLDEAVLVAQDAAVHTASLRPGEHITAGLAVLSAEVVHAYGVSGPAARASGVRADLRRDRPYLAYDELAEWLTPLPATDGDALGRFETMIAEVQQSASLVQVSAERLRTLAGPVATDLGKIVRLPEGEGYLATEAPLGRSGFFVVSRGERTPWRLKLRTPSFNNVAAWEQILPGCPTDELETALASLGYVVGDLDK